MQGDIFQMEQMAVQVHATQVKPTSLSVDDGAHAEVAIYNEDDLSHLLYANHIRHDGHKHKVVVNHVYRDGFSTPPESLSTGTQTPVSETDETPVFSDCESDFDEGVSLPSPFNVHSRKNPLRFEDGFEFPVFLGRQSEELAPHETAPPSLKEPASELGQSKHVAIAAAEADPISDISGPLMSWWPGPMELMEHEWVEEKTVESKNANFTLSHEHVSSIEGPLMSWWPTPLSMMEHEWNERFYE
ncbi:hypothetical protein F4820DRAFT_417163 [Hypoxylon rubiginosum]|uniref:Uncharacterized protein n=1 Tax=Hypoxylon rubiginosum TaxID=110542 RepID=A0ACB9Z5M2_9PEZI|nr:hypothetical protein F4820DRAFT_417163 [Hypoxylon rubiginosum]